MVKITDKLNNLVTVYFSYNRPMQLDLALTTNRVCSKNHMYQEEVVLYKTDEERFSNAYEIVAKEHPSVSFIKENNFKDDLNNIIKNKKYVMFVVDDCIFTQDYYIEGIISILDNFLEAVGFSLRLGTNTKYCYPLYKNNPLPRFFYDVGFNKRMMGFSWKEVPDGDFSYPLELSSSVYRVNNVKSIIEKTNYNNPNELEHILSMNLHLYAERLPYLLSFKKSVAFCNPVNKVRTGNNNRSWNNDKYSVDNLLDLFERGYRIDYERFYGFVSSGCHQEAEFFLKGLQE